MDAFLIEPHQQVARLLSYPPTVGVRRDPGQVNAASRELNEEQNLEPLQEQRVDREEIALEDARRLLGGNSAQLASSRIGAGSIPASLRIVHTVLAASLIPSPTSSPWIRRYLWVPKTPSCLTSPQKCVKNDCWRFAIVGVAGTERRAGRARGLLPARGRAHAPK